LIFNQERRKQKMKIVLKNVRLAFPALFSPKAFNEGDPAFSGSFIFGPDSPNLKLLEDTIEKVAKEKWGEKAPAMLKAIKAKGNVCLRDGSDKADYNGFEGNFYVSARTKTRPLVVDRDKSPLAESDGRPYGGCFVNAQIDVWPQDNNYGKRINAKLLGVQFAKDGASFGGGSAANIDDFDELEEDEAYADLI
jgi:hypothetical protein